MLYTINKNNRNTKVNCCFYCKKKKPLDDFVIKEELAEYYKGVCKHCYKYHTSVTREYKKGITNYKNGSLKIFNKFKEDYLRMEFKYLKELDASIKTIPNKVEIITRMFKYGVKKGYIYSYCISCLKYKTSPMLKLDGSAFRKTTYPTNLCDACIYKRNKKTKKYDPVKQRLHRKMWEIKLVVDESTGETLKRVKLKDLDRYRRNIRLTNFEKQKFKDLILKADELSKTLNIKIQLDHIIPLKGKYISGLNHPDNIQLLGKIVNNTKNNKMIFKEGLSFEELLKLNTLDYNGFNPYLNINFEKYLTLCD